MINAHQKIILFDKKTQKKLDSINLDKRKVKEYSLPDTVKTQSAFTWFNKIRPYYLNSFKEQMYGLMAPRPDIVEFEQLDYKNNAFQDELRALPFCGYLVIHSK